MSWLHLLLGALAYRALATDGAAGVAGQDIEDLLFEPSEKSALLVLAVAAWLIYRRRHHILALPVGSASAGVLALFIVPGTLLFGWALYTGATDLLLISLGLEALGVCAAWRGNAATRALMLPAFCLVLAVPIPAPLLSEIVWSFQLWTAQLGGWMLSAIGVPVFVSGDLIFRARDTFQVIESCSGLRSVETLTLLAILMVDLFRRRGAHAVLLVAAAPPCAFAINGFRVVTIMLNPHSETIAIHTLQGIVVLQVGLLVLYFFDMGLRRWLKHEPAPLPSRMHDRLPIAPTTRRSSATAVLFAALGIASFAMPRYAPPRQAVLDLAGAIPREIGEWQARKLPLDYWFLGGSLGFRQTISRRYESVDPSSGETLAVDLFGGIGDHSQRTRTPFSAKLGWPGSGWFIDEPGSLLGEDGAPTHWHVVRRDRERRLVYYWYEGAAGVGIEALRTLTGIDQSPFRRAEPGIAFRLSTEIKGQDARAREDAEKKLQRFRREIRERLADR